MFAPNSTQKEVFAAAGAPLTAAVLNGYNSAIIAYGATGSGKSYTMMVLCLYQILVTVNKGYGFDDGTQQQLMTASDPYAMAEALAPTLKGNKAFFISHISRHHPKNDGLDVFIVKRINC